MTSFLLVVVTCEWCPFSLLCFFVLLLLIVANINTWTFSFDASSKFGLRVTIAKMRLFSISLNLSKVISFSILFYEFKVFLITLDNSIKTAFSVTWSSNIDSHFFYLKDFLYTIQFHLQSYTWYFFLIL